MVTVVGNLNSIKFIGYYLNFVVIKAPVVATIAVEAIDDASLDYLKVIFSTCISNTQHLQSQQDLLLLQLLQLLNS